MVKRSPSYDGTIRRKSTGSVGRGFESHQAHYIEKHWRSSYEGRYSVNECNSVFQYSGRPGNRVCTNSLMVKRPAHNRGSLGSIPSWCTTYCIDTVAIGAAVSILKHFCGLDNEGPTGSDLILFCIQKKVFQYGIV